MTDEQKRAMAEWERKLGEIEADLQASQKRIAKTMLILKVVMWSAVAMPFVALIIRKLLK